MGVKPTTILERLIRWVLETDLAGYAAVVVTIFTVLLKVNGKFIRPARGVVKKCPRCGLERLAKYDYCCNCGQFFGEKSPENHTPDSQESWEFVD